jgi:hypothetical protein
MRLAGRRSRPSEAEPLLLSAARRFSLLFAGVAVVTVGVSAVLGAAAGASFDRAVSLGFYLVGSFLAVAGFFVGNRGPIRRSDSTGASSFGSRIVRVATPEEREETINSSALFVVLGIVFVVLGVFVDSRYRLV